MRAILIIIFSLISFVQFGQDTYDIKISKLKNITDMPYICRDTIGEVGCGQDEFWDVIKGKKEIIPFLIETLDDTTKTSAYVPNFGGYWTVADISFQAINEIIKDIPTFDLLGVAFDSEGCGYCSYWNHLRKDINNRIAFKKNVSDWYDGIKDKLKWVKSDETLTCDCKFDHPNGGHYEIKK
jgi:hypothetical protein